MPLEEKENNQLVIYNKEERLNSRLWNWLTNILTPSISFNSLNPAFLYFLGPIFSGSILFYYVSNKIDYTFSQIHIMVSENHLLK